MSIGQTWDMQSSEPDERQQVIRFVGGAAAVTKLFGRGATVTYISTGIVDIAWAERQGEYLGVAGWGFDATAQAGLKGWTVVGGDFNTTTNTLRINITNASETLADMSSSQRLSIRIAFRQTSA
jgi:hypothetical protein